MLTLLGHSKPYQQCYERDQALLIPVGGDPYLLGVRTGLPAKLPLTRGPNYPAPRSLSITLLAKLINYKDSIEGS